MTEIIISKPEVISFGFDPTFANCAMLFVVVLILGFGMYMIFRICRRAWRRFLKSN